MPRILGLDLGSNSIGWSLVETSTNGKSGKLLATGVRVFPEGVDRDQTGSEKPKNEKRRIARGMRRQIARRARRKATLRRHLQQLGWIPVLEADRLAWDRLDPYELRDKALREALTLPELARVLVHLNQRRGFLSNRKADAAQRKENSATLQEISQLASELQGSTLGQHLAEKRKDPYRRVRGIHTHRQMFLDEFDRIWCAQQKYHPKVLTEQLRNGQTIPDERRYPREPLPRRDHKRVSLLDRFGLFGLIFFQRDLYWPRSVVGNCELEPKQKRCERADRLAQRFRLLQEVNNLRIIPGYQKDRELTPDERSELLKYLSGRKEATFDEIRKKLKLLEGTGFNLEVGDRRKLQGMPIDALLGNKNYFGKAWEKFSDEWKNQIVRDLLDNDEPTLRDKAARDWQLPPETIERLLETDLGQGYMSYSRMAIQKLLPYLEEELPLMSKDGSPSALQRAGYLRPDQRVVNQKESLPAVPDDILNPLVKQALFEVRKVVNGLLREYGKPDAIHIEMAREVKGNSIVRAKQAADMRSRERLREQAADAIRELGDKATHNKIDRWLLWREQGEICLYSGKNISPRKLLSGEVDVDHILPYSKSLDNSLMNKVICFRSENALKGQNTIHQWLAASNPQKLEQILQRAMKLPLDIRNRKLTKLKQETVVLDEFLQRQLSDTAYITSKVRE